MEFRKVLAGYYRKWLEDCIDSEKFCILKGWTIKAENYRKLVEEYSILISENEKAINFFSIGDNAFLKDSCLPEEFRGFK